MFLTDRRQLDSQLTATFGRTQDETIIHVDSIRELRQQLSTDASDLITSTVQKFQEIEVADIV